MSVNEFDRTELKECQNDRNHCGNCKNGMCKFNPLVSNYVEEKSLWEILPDNSVKPWNYGGERMKLVSYPKFFTWTSLSFYKSINQETIMNTKKSMKKNLSQKTKKYKRL